MEKLEQDGICIKARLVGQSVDDGYTTYVFQDVVNYEFIMVTRVPNWKGEPPQLLQEGFMKYKFVRGGQDSYYDTEKGQFKTYQYTNHYFLDFVPITHVLRDGFVAELGSIIIN